MHRSPASGPSNSVDIFDACWIWPQANLATTAAIDVDVGSIPYNFQLWNDARHVRLRKASTASGELQIRRGGCTGKPWLTLPLKTAVSNIGQTTLRATVPAKAKAGVDDLCFVVTRPNTKTLWVVGEVRLVE